MPGFTGLSRETFSHRVAAVRRYLIDNGLDGLFAFSDEYRPGSTLYLADYYPINVIEESPQGVYVPAEGQVTLFLGAINARTAEAISWIEDIRAIDTLGPFFKRLREQAGRELKLGLVGEALLPIKYYRRMLSALAQSEFVCADDLLNGMRAIKCPDEVALMEQAAHLADKGLKAAIERLKAGDASENDLAAAAEHPVRLGGANLGSATIVSAGQHTQLPTWRPSDHEIAPGDPVLIDVNPIYRGYCADTAVTVFHGDADGEKRRVLDLSRDVLRGVIDHLRPGQPASTIYGYLLEKSEAAGYGEQFRRYARGMRAVGHGVGINVVEWPNLDADSDFLLEPGMTLAIKYDLRGFDWGGTRFEVDVLMEEGGCRPLNLILDYDT